MTAHDPQMAALLAGVPPQSVAAAPGLARLLSSLMSPQARAPSVGPDLLAEARAEGEAAGRLAGEVAGRAAAEAELAPLRTALHAAAEAMREASQIDAARLTPLLAELVKAAAEAVLMAELGAGGRVLQPLVAAALADVAEAALPTISAHPDTLALIAADLPSGLAAIGDAALPPGHIVVSGPDFRIEAGLGERLSRLVEGLAWA